jgi:3-hydroxyacyl-CoA dehydrogenase
MQIKKAAVLGAGVMGAQIAAHLANAGIPCLLLDIAPRELTPEEAAKGLTLESPAVRNRIANAGLEGAKKAKPAAFMSPELSSLVSVGNFDDDLPKLKDCDWIVEAIVENLDIKRSLFERVEPHLHAEAIITSNTSGIPIKSLAEGRSEGFRKRFLGTHFFNPPRYMKLLEVIPGPDTSRKVVKFVKQFGEDVLGKGVVICKDRPNFIANRLGSFLGTYAMRYAYENDYRVDEVDSFTGPEIGHPKTATFRLCDLVGVDIMYHVADNLYNAVADDEARADLKPPEFLKLMVERKMLGNKTGGGFYKEVREESGKKKFYALNLKTFEYEKPEKFFFDSVGNAEMVETLPEKLRAMTTGDDRAAKFVWDTTAHYLAYASHRVPEIADDIVSIDNAMKWGFAHDAGPFETWDMLGVQETVARMEREDIAVAPWVKEMLANGNASFYQNGSYYDVASQTYKAIAKAPNVIVLKNTRVLTENESATLRDLGDGVACLEFHTKMNALDDNIITVADAALAEVDRNFVGMVIGNQGEHFSAGANVLSVGLAAENAEWDQINAVTKALQDFLMRVRYNPKPIVTAPFGYTLGGGCEVAMAGSRIVAHAESYVGLVEVGMGLIPAGGGVKEMLRRVVAPAMQTQNADALPFLQRVFETVGTAKVATSAEEAKQMGFFGPDTRVVMNRDQLIAQAKQTVLHMAAENYQAPARAKIYAAGERALAAMRIAIYSMLSGKYISEYDAFVGEKLAYVLCGGNLTAPAWVDEQYILDLEREAFVSLCGQEKTRERIWHFLNTGKPLRN